MNLIRIFYTNFFVAILFLIYLCALDLLFVLEMNEQDSIVNELGFLIVLMPFIGCTLTCAIARRDSTGRKILMCVFIFIVLTVVGFFEYLWVATHFHSLIGGTI